MTLNYNYRTAMAYDAFYLTYKQDTETNDRFEAIRKRCPNIRLVKINLKDWNDNKITDAITKLSTISNTKFFWVIDADVEVSNDFDFEYQVSEWDEDVVHLWNAEERNVFRSIVGVKLFKRSMITDDYITQSYYMTGPHKLHETTAVKYLPTREFYDVFFWDQGYGYDTLETLRNKIPTVQVVKEDSHVDVHKVCQEKSRTDLYYLVTPNTVVNEDFNFDYSFEFGLDKENQKIVVWKKANPITGLEREFNGIGLFPKGGKIFEEEDYKIWNFRRNAVYEKATIATDRKFPIIISDNLDDLSHEVDSDMYWLISPDVKNFDPSYYPFQYDRDTIHNFRVRLHNNKTTRGGIRLVPRNPDRTKEKDIQDVVLGEIDKPTVIQASTLYSGLNKVENYPAIIVDSALSIKRSFSFYPDIYDTVSAYTFGEEPGVVYLTRPYDAHSVKNIEVNATTVPDFDIFFVDQGFGEKNYVRLKERFADRVKKITASTLASAHAIASEQTKHEYYYIVSADTIVTDDFNFDYRAEFSMTEKGRQQIVVWQKTDNDGNDLGYHGVGLFRKNYIAEEKFLENRVERFYFRRHSLYVESTSVKHGEYDVIVTDNLFDVDAVSRADSNMVWVVHPDVQDVDLSYKPLAFDLMYGHNFCVNTAGGTAITNGVRLLPRLGYTDDRQKDVDLVVGTFKEYERVSARTIEEGIALAKNDTFWIVNPDLDVDTNIINNFYPALYETGPTHVWKFTNQSGEDLGYGGLILTNKDYHVDNMIYHEEFCATMPKESRVPVYYSRDMYDVYKQTEGQDFYWVVDPVVELMDDFDFDFYPNIHQIENVFTFSVEQQEDSKVKSGSGVYLVYRPHLAEHSPTERQFSFDKFKNMITIDRVVSRVAEHPAYYFNEGMYSDNVSAMEERGVEVIDATGGLLEAYTVAANKTSTGYFWAIDNDVVLKSNFDKRYYVDRHNRDHFHLWPKLNPLTNLVHQYGGLRLVPANVIISEQPDSDTIRKTLFKGKKPIKADAATEDALYDVIFLSYNEPFADDNYEKLLTKVPHAKRVHGVKGIFNAHKQAAELADTRMFYVVDADAILLNEFDFQYYPTVWDEDIIHTWQSKNPINDLVYGYGGLKLFPTKLLREATDWNIDFTTSVGEKFKPMPIVANYTAFNTDGFNTWKSAFRECAKLSASIIQNGVDSETEERLEMWCTRGADRKFGDYALEGANAGKEYGKKYIDNFEELNKINDFKWLEEKFKEQYND